ncbi:hypothetical protein D3C84_774790 [compost metagenome]
MPHASAFHFAEDHQLPEQSADETDGVAQFGPAHRILPGAIGGDMLVGLTGVMPEKLPLIEPRIGIELEMQRLDLGHAFKGVQVRAGAKHRRGIGVGPAFANQPGVPSTGGIAGAGEHATGLFKPLAFDDFPAQRTEG